MQYREIFEETVNFFARSELSPRMNEEKNEIYVHAPLGRIYTHCDLFIRFTVEAYSVDAYIDLESTDNETAMLKFINMVNLSSDGCTLALDDSHLLCRNSLTFEGATASLVRKSIYQPLYTLNLIAKGIKAVTGGDDPAHAYEIIFT